MSDKPKEHPLLNIEPDRVRMLLAIDNLGTNEALMLGKIAYRMTPDEAVALGYALFEHGLFLKGRMKP